MSLGRPLIQLKRQRDKQQLADFKRVEGKNQILYRVAEAIVANSWM